MSPRSTGMKYIRFFDIYEKMIIQPWHWPHSETVPKLGAVAASPKIRDGFAKATLASQKQLSRCETKADFINLKQLFFSCIHMIVFTLLSSPRQIYNKLFDIVCPSVGQLVHLSVLLSICPQLFLARFSILQICFRADIQFRITYFTGIGVKFSYLLKKLSNAVVF